MFHTPTAARGMVSAPHHLAAQAGLAVLREGGNAIEAAIAAAAACSVVYPHLSGLGGDGFWLIHEPGKAPISIDASGVAGGTADADAYRQQGLSTVPTIGPLAAATVAGAVSGWQASLEISSRWGGRLPLTRLFEDAIYWAEHGFSVTTAQAEATSQRLLDIREQDGFAGTFLAAGQPPVAGSAQSLPGLAALFKKLAQSGLDDFYRGAIGHHLGAELQRLGSPVSSADLARNRSVRDATAYNLPPPSQGLAALMILGLFERLDVKEAESFAHIHALVEAAKQAFDVRDRHITDPSYMSIHSTTYLTPALLDRIADGMDRTKAQAWQGGIEGGATAWIGVVDKEGRAVSCVHSLGDVFGSGLAVGEFGLLWHNRGTAFSIKENSQNLLIPGRKPFHALCPAMAQFHDGRLMLCGGMGDDGQPQSQAQIYTRAAIFGQSLQQAITAPRWELVRHGDSHVIRVESRLDHSVIAALRAAGHQVEIGEAFDRRFGHTGALLRHHDGRLEGTVDPRFDGGVAAY